MSQQSREEFMKKMGLTQDDLKTPNVRVDGDDYDRNGNDDDDGDDDQQHHRAAAADTNQHGARQLSPGRGSSNPKPGELPVDDSFIRTASLADTEALKASPDNVTATVAYREEQLKKFRETRVATMTREMGLEDGVGQHSQLAKEGHTRHNAAQSYRAQLLAEFRKKRQHQPTNQHGDEL